MTLKIMTVFSSIADLNVNGLTIKDIGEVTETFEVRGPVLYPQIANPITFQPPKRVAFGTGASVSRDIVYTLHYRLLYLPVGSERGTKEIYSPMFDLVSSLFDAVIAGDPLDGSIEIMPKIESSSTTVLDPAGRSFYGLDIAFDVLEFYEVA